MKACCHRQCQDYKVQLSCHHHHHMKKSPLVFWRPQLLLLPLLLLLLVLATTTIFTMSEAFPVCVGYMSVTKPRSQQRPSSPLKATTDNNNNNNNNNNDDLKSSATTTTTTTGPTAVMATPTTAMTLPTNRIQVCCSKDCTRRGGGTRLEKLIREVNIYIYIYIVLWVFSCRGGGWVGGVLCVCVCIFFCCAQSCVLLFCGIPQNCIISIYSLFFRCWKYANSSP
jgi:hypothetical protein